MSDGPWDLHERVPKGAGLLSRRRIVVEVWREGDERGHR